MVAHVHIEYSTYQFSIYFIFSLFMGIRKLAQALSRSNLNYMTLIEKRISGNNMFLFQKYDLTYTHIYKSRKFARTEHHETYLNHRY